MPISKKKIGILGGIGAAATAYFFSKLIEKLQAKGLKKDSDFPEIILDSLPFVGLTAKGSLVPGKEKIIVTQLVAGIKKLEIAGAEFVVIPCSSVHIFFPQLKEKIKIPLVNIVKEITQVVALRNIKKVGILASEITRKFGLYEHFLDNWKIEVIWPSFQDQQRINHIISKIVAGINNKADAKELQKIVKKLVAADAEGVILGCTELPIVAKDLNKDYKGKIFDISEILAERIAEISLSRSFLI